MVLKAVIYIENGTVMVRLYNEQFVNKLKAVLERLINDFRGLMWIYSEQLNLVLIAVGWLPVKWRVDQFYVYLTEMRWYAVNLRLVSQTALYIAFTCLEMMNLYKKMHGNT